MRKQSDLVSSSHCKTGGCGIAAPRDSSSAKAPSPEALRALVRLLARATAREILKSGTPAVSEPPIELPAPPAKPKTDADL
jgi:hypothetical protein